MAEKDCQEHAVSISEQETVQGLTSTGPPAYSEVMTYGWTIQNDPQRNLAPPYEPPSVPTTNPTLGPVVHSSASGVSTGSTVATSFPLQFATVTQSRIDGVYSTAGTRVYSQTCLQNAVRVMIVILLILIFVGTPLTLFCTVPALYCTCKVYSILAYICI